MPRSRALVVALLVLAVTTAGGCAVGPSARPAVAIRQSDVPATPDDGSSSTLPPAPPPLLPPLVPSPASGVTFDDCTGTTIEDLGGPGALRGRDLRFGCATVPVGGSGTAPLTELGVLRVTRGPASPRGSVPIAVVGEAGGRTGSDQAIRLAATAPDRLLDGTALYGVDQRGVGASEPADCITPTTRAAIDDTDPTATSVAALTPLLDASATAARTCSQVLEEAVSEYRTGTNADDLEQVRRALGVGRLHTIGLGDGAGVVAEWSQRYPSGVGRTVLDGLPDLTATATTRADQGAEAARGALAAFAADCTTRPGCPLGPDPAGAVRGVLDRLHAAPGEGPDGRPVTDGTAVTALVDGLADPDTWPALATTMAAAGRGDVGPLLAASDAAEADGGGYDTALMNRCNDTTERLTVDQVAAAAARARAADPTFGAWFVQRALVCASWPVPTDPPQPPRAAGVPPLLLATAADPRTPLAGTQRVAAGLEGATLVSWLGAGHGAYPATPCVTGAVGTYLFDGNIPRQGTVCPP